MDANAFLMKRSKSIKTYSFPCLICAGRKFNSPFARGAHYRQKHPGVSIPQTPSKPSKPIPKPIQPKAPHKVVPKIKKRKTNKGKILPRTTGSQRLKALAIAKKNPQKAPFYRQKMDYYKKQEKFLNSLSLEEQRSKNYFLQKEDDYRVTGRFPKQQAKVKEDVLLRRGYGKPVSTLYIRKKMRQVCRKDRPDGYDPQKYKFGQHWVTNFMDKNGLSVRRKTNIKGSSIWERLHKVHNYHWYTQYQMATEDISSEEEEEDEAECLDQIDESDVSSESEEESSSSEDTSESEESCEDESSSHES